MPVRTFVAIPLAEAITARLVKAREALAPGARVRWVEANNIHLTLKFLGGVNDADLAEVCRLAGQIAARTERFALSVAGLLAVPPAGELRMVWAGVVERTGRLEKLQATLEQAYAHLGFRAENRRFHPHLTLGRVKSGQDVRHLREAVAGFSGTDFGTQQAEELVVFASQLTPAGPIYSPLKTAPLGQTA
jgi:2'-5' RNA ligase